MIVKYSQVFPYWIYGDNKIASHDKLNEWLDQNGIEDDNSFKINEITKDRLSIISKNPNIKYIEVYTDLKTYYYYQTNIEFIANKTYQVSFDLDWYATYGLDLIRNLNGKNVFVKRSHHALTNIFETALFQDERLENISPVFSNLKFLEDDLISYMREGKTFYKINGGRVGFALDTYKFVNIYAIWKIKGIEPNDTRGGYYIYPISTQTDWQFANMYMTNETSQRVFSFNNNIEKIRIINNNSEWANAFMGVFVGPSFIYMGQDATVKRINNTTTDTLLCRMFDRTYFKEYTIDKPLINFTGNQKLMLNHSGGIYSPTILNYLELMIGNSKLDALNFDLTNDNKFKIKNGFINFNESNFTFYTDLKLEGFNEIVKHYPGPLTSEARPYLEYIAQNKNRLNTSLAISGVGMVGSLATSIATGNPLGLLGVMGGMRNIANITANLSDKKRELLDKPNASYDNDNAFYSLFNLLKNIKSTPLVYYRILKNLDKYNNEIVYYGWKQNKYLPFKTTGLNKHFYLQIDANELFNQYPQLFTKTPQIYLKEIIDLLNNGLRLWNDVVVQYE